MRNCGADDTVLLHSSASYGRGIEFNPLGSTKFHPFVVRFIVGEMLLSTLITFNNCIAPPIRCWRCGPKNGCTEFNRVILESLILLNILIISPAFDITSRFEP